MPSSARRPDTWLRATVGLLLAHAACLAALFARPGLLAVVLWYIAPTLLLLGAATLLGVALAQSWRARELPGGRRLAGLAALALVVGSLALLRTYPSSYDGRPSSIPFRLPLDGRVTVAWGGPTLRVNYHAAMPDQRWAYDLLVTDDGASFRGDGRHVEDYHAFGLPVVAPADGTVFDVHDEEEDGPIGQWRVRRAPGNHVVLHVAPGEYLFIAHLQADSIVVSRGERVRAGQVIGRVGNSGNSSEPHVHLHLQDTPRVALGEGIPLYFHGYRTTGPRAPQLDEAVIREQIVDRGMPVGGRQRRSRAWPGAFTGERVEHVARPGNQHSSRPSRVILVQSLGPERNDGNTMSTDTKVIYWHGELPPLDAEQIAEHVVEATSMRIKADFAHRDELWERCHHDLMAHAEDRLKQEVTRLSGHYAHVLAESIDSGHDEASGEAWLHGRFTYLLLRRPLPAGEQRTDTPDA